MDCKLTAINLYPVKSLGGISLDRCRATSLGLEGDRRWLLTDLDGRFLTQRTHPSLAVVQVSRLGEDFQVSAPGLPALILPTATGGPRRTVIIWNDTVEAVDGPEQASSWFSNFLGLPCRLAYMDEQCRRPVHLPAASDEYPGAGDLQVSFADGFPCLLISTDSVDLLNSKLKSPVTADRFRANLVVSGCPPHAEDSWTRFQLGEAVFRGVKLCSRCQVPTIDQQTGEVSPLQEPMRTLATYRTRPGGVMFGMNLVVEKEGIVQLGDRLTVLATL
jgi:uncharacterized protein YcbX